MRATLSSCLAAISIGFLAAVAHAEPGPERMKDATGVALPENGGKARTRIVALAPSLAELAADFLGADLDRLVGVSEYSDYPEAVKRRTSVGPFQQFDVEKVVALKPDLVLATADGNSRDQVLRLRELHLPVVVVRTSTLPEIAQSMRIAGKVITGDAARGEAMASQFLKGIESLQARGNKIQGAGNRVLLQVGEDPLVVAGGGSFLNEAVETVGFRNVYGDLKTAWPRPALEDVVSRDPGVILVLTMGDEAASARRSAARWNERKTMSAVKAGRVYIMNGDLLLRPTLRMLEGLSLLQKRLANL